MYRALTAIILGATCVSGLAQMTPVGLWRNVDDKTGEAKAEIRIVDAAGVLSGKLDKRLGKEIKPDDVCTECSDDRKGRALIGLQIIRNAKKAEGKDVWEGGKILDPKTVATTRCA